LIFSKDFMYMHLSFFVCFFNKEKRCSNKDSLKRNSV